MRNPLIVCFLLSASVNAQQLVDPTMPEGYVSGGLGIINPVDDKQKGIVISAVFINGASKVAVINGQTVAEGEEWKGYTVTRIRNTGVLLESQGRSKELLINQNSIKKDASNDF